MLEVRMEIGYLCKEYVPCRKSAVRFLILEWMYAFEALMW